MAGTARPVRARGGATWRAAGAAAGARWEGAGARRPGAGAGSRGGEQGACCRRGQARVAGSRTRACNASLRAPRASHHHSAQASTRRSSCGSRPTSKMQRKLGDSIHFSNMFQALLNSQWYFRLFTSRSLTSQAANDLFIVGNVPRTKESIQDVMETISKIRVCSAQIEIFRVSRRQKPIKKCRRCIWTLDGFSPEAALPVRQGGAAAPPPASKEPLVPFSSSSGAAVERRRSLPLVTRVHLERDR